VAGVYGGGGVSKKTLGSLSTSDWLLFAYLGLIFVFGILYSFPGAIIAEVSIPIERALYFSVVTQTTLGYGDITPTKGFGYFLVSLQVLLGILIIGVMLARLSKNWADTQMENEKLIEANRYASNQKVLATAHFQYLAPVLFSYSFASRALVMSSVPAALAGAEKFSLPENIRFSDMKCCFPQLNMVGAMRRPRIVNFLEIESKLRYEIRAFRLATDPALYSQLHELASRFETLCASYEIAPPILEFVDVPKEQKDSEGFISRLWELVREADDVPSFRPRSLLNPYVRLWQTLPERLDLANRINAEFEAISGSANNGTDESLLLSSFEL
jgi:hypothetical protein